MTSAAKFLRVSSAEDESPPAPRVEALEDSAAGEQRIEELLASEQALKAQVRQLESRLRSVLLDTESIYRFFAQKEAPFSLALKGDGPSGDLDDLLRDAVKALGAERDRAVSDYEAALDELATARDDVERERKRRHKAERERKAALEEQGNLQAQLRSQQREVERLREEAELRQRAAVEDRSEPKESAQDLESGGEVERLRSEIEGLKEDHASEQLRWEGERSGYRSQIRQLDAKLRNMTQEAVADEIADEAEEPEIESVADAVLAASQLERLTFLKSAWEAAEDSQSNRGPDLYKAFRMLDRLAAEYRTGLGGKGVKEWFQEQGAPFAYAAHLSDTTAGKREQTYTFGGIFMPKHLKFSGGHNTQNLLRVHFEYEFDDDPPRCVIGHVGEHLPNEMS